MAKRGEASKTQEARRSSVAGKCEICGGQREGYPGALSMKLFKPCANPSCVKERERRSAAEACERAKRREEALNVFARRVNRDMWVHMQNENVPRLYINARLSDFDGSYPTAAGRSGLFITGAVGCGKTHLAAAMLAAWLEGALIEGERTGQHYYPSACGKWTTVPEFLMRLRGTFRRDAAETEERVVREYLKLPFLVLDDLGAEKATDWTGQSLYVLVSGRINACLPTVVTSNLTLGELHDSDPRLASRLGGMAYLELPGKDRRLQ